LGLIHFRLQIDLRTFTFLDPAHFLFDIIESIRPYDFASLDVK
jgi:hypothetical protein